MYEDLDTDVMINSDNAADLNMDNNTDDVLNLNIVNNGSNQQKQQRIYDEQNEKTETAALARNIKMFEAHRAKGTLKVYIPKQKLYMVCLFYMLLEFVIITYINLIHVYRNGAFILITRITT